METELQVVILVFSLLFLAAVISLLLKRIRLPFTVAILLVGLLLGTLAASQGLQPEGPAGEHQTSFATDFFESLRSLSNLSPALILFIFLPTLIFESAISLDARKLLQNLVPILVLAIPGLLLSTAIVGAALVWGAGESFGVTWPVALLFGALISATDPVAVVAMFRELGAPPRLTMLVEGESLFNDGTAIVLFNILLGVVTGTVVTSGFGSFVLRGVWDFAVVFLGGILVGFILAFLFAQIISWVRNDELVEITLTTVLAYASFVIAEHYLHVSGVMSTVAAGVTLASYGRTKISPPVQEFMHRFWQYMAYIANALIFFLVGIVIPQRVPFPEWGSYLGPLGITIVAVIVARAVGIYTLVPLVGRFTERIGFRFKTIMFWGGLRGAVALALALAVANHPDVPDTIRGLFLTLAAGVIMTTLLVNALTIRPLLEFFGLHKYDRGELFLRGEGMLSVLRQVRGELSRLQEEKSFSPPVLERLGKQYEERVRKLQDELKDLKSQEQGLSTELESSVVLGQCLAIERRAYQEFYAGGLLPEETLKALQHSIDRLFDRLKVGGELPEDRSQRHQFYRLVTVCLTSLEKLPLLASWASNRKADLLADRYDIARGLYRGCQIVIKEMEEMRATGAVDPLALAEVERNYQNWMAHALEHMKRIDAQYPEYAEQVQALLAGRHCLNLEMEGYRRLGEMNIIPDKVVDEMQRDVEARMESVRDTPRTALRFEIRDLLRQVPFFREVPEKCVEALARCGHAHTVLEEEIIFREGDLSDTLYLIARGAVRISVTLPDRILAVLGPGDFFGEMALLSSNPRTATASAVTPANLIELRRQDVQGVEQYTPELRRALETAFRERLLDQWLARHPAFADLNKSQRGVLAKFFHSYKLSAQQELAHNTPCMMLVRSGEVQAGDRLLGEGDLHGVEIFTENWTPGEIVRARKPAELFLFGESDLEYLRAEAPDIAALVARRLSRADSA